MTITFGSLFAGIGGIDLGLERAGMTCKWQVEFDPFCQHVLQKYWPHVSKFGDIRELIGNELERVDVVAGGFPCQPVSLAGKGKAQNDARWLWPQFERIIRLLAPDYVLVENVPGLAQRGLAIVLGTVADLGFDAEWTCVSANSMGAPHLRDRIFVVAYAQRLELREQSRGSGGSRRQGSPLIAFDGEFGQLASDPAGEVADAEIFTERAGLRPHETAQEWWRRSGYCGSENRAWAAEPDVGRVAYGISNRVDRLRALGNAVVPQVAEFVGRRIVEAAA